jgi:hypothetical protein
MNDDDLARDDDGDAEVCTVIQNRLLSGFIRINKTKCHVICSNDALWAVGGDP